MKHHGSEMHRRAFLVSIAAAALPTTQGATTAQARAQRQMLFLAEDVPVSLNLDGPAVTVNTSQVGWINVQEPLVSYPSKGADNFGFILPDLTKFEGRLAESWTYDEAKLAWTFKLRRGVVSAAGNSFTADDVIYTFERAKSLTGRSSSPWIICQLASVKGFTPEAFRAKDTALGDAVEKIDDHTVVIRQSQPNYMLLLNLTGHAMLIFDSKAMREKATQQDPWSHDYANTQGVFGFGAYSVERLTRDNEFIVKAHAGYYRGKPAVERVVMKKVPQSSNRVVTLRSRQAHLTQSLAPREFEGLQSARGVRVGGVFGNETLFLSPNHKSPLYSNLLVRRALAHAIDYDQIINAGYLGRARRWYGQIPSSFPGYIRPNAVYEFNPDRARSLLAEAGFSGGVGLERFADELRMSYAAEREVVLGPIASMIQTSLRNVGIPMILDPLPQTQLTDRRVIKRDLPLALSDRDKAINVDAIYAIGLFFASRAVAGLVNTNNYMNEEVDRKFLQARATLDAGDRNVFAASIQEILQQDLAWIPVVETRTEWAWAEGLKGMRWWPDNAIRWVDLSLGG